MSLREFYVPKRSRVWLVYLGTLLFQPAFDPAATWVEWAVTALIAVAFLPVYGWADRHATDRPYLWRGGPGGLLGIAAILAMGVLLAPVNAGTSVFFIYAAAIGARVRPRRLAVTTIAASIALVPLAAVVSVVPFPYLLYPYLPSLVFAAIIGVSNYYERERYTERARLRMAQDEVERLATIAERERIARDLHDLLGHTLSTITLKAELAGRLLERDAAAAAREIADVERISRDALGQVREAVRGYRASGLEGEMANAKLALEAAGVEYDYYFDRIDLPAATEGVLALAVREGVTNVVRHADARRCQVRLEAIGNTAVLTVADDGTLPPEAPTEGGGLAGMRSRVGALAGTVALRRDGNRTVLEVILPLGPRSERRVQAVGEAPATA